MSKIKKIGEKIKWKKEREKIEYNLKRKSESVEKGLKLIGDVEYKKVLKKWEIYEKIKSMKYEL